MIKGQTLVISDGNIIFIIELDVWHKNFEIEEARREGERRHGGEGRGGTERREG